MIRSLNLRARAFVPLPFLIFANVHHRLAILATRGTGRGQRRWESGIRPS